MSVPVGCALALVIIIALVVLMSTKKPGPNVADERFEAQDEPDAETGTEVEEPDTERPDQ